MITTSTASDYSKKGTPALSDSRRPCNAVKLKGKSSFEVASYYFFADRADETTWKKETDLDGFHHPSDPLAYLDVER